MVDSLNDLRSQHLVETDWLESRLGDPAIRIVDMRGQVRINTNPDGSQSADYLGARDEYAAGHIPGAVYLDWTSDLIDTDDPIPAQVAPPEKISRVLGSAGIGNDSLVVAYDGHPASQFATRLWWVLRYYGHDSVCVLNGGWNRWLAEGRAVSHEIPDLAPAVFTPRLRPDMRATAEEVLASLNRPDVALIDARDEAQYTDRIRRGPRSGHIPGAIHLPRERVIGADGRFLPTEELKAAVDSIGMNPGKRAIAYCNGGVAATSLLFALSMLGFPKLTNYDGSWNEWSKREDLPVESRTPRGGEK